MTSLLRPTRAFELEDDVDDDDVDDDDFDEDDEDEADEDDEDGDEGNGEEEPETWQVLERRALKANAGGPLTSLHERA